MILRFGEQSKLVLLTWVWTTTCAGQWLRPQSSISDRTIHSLKEDVGLNNYVNTLGLTVHKLPLLVLFSLALPSLDCLELPIGAGDFSSIIPHLLLKRSELQKSSSQIFTNFVNLSIADPSFDNLAVTLKQNVEWRSVLNLLMSQYWPHLILSTGSSVWLTSQL